MNILSLVLLIVLFHQQTGNTPLIMAAKGGHTDAVKELLSSGATVDLANEASAWKCVPLSCSVVLSPFVFCLLK